MEHGQNPFFLQMLQQACPLIQRSHDDIEHMAVARTFAFYKRKAEDALREQVRENHGAFCARIAAGDKLGDAERELFVNAAKTVAGRFIKENDRADR